MPSHPPSSTLPPRRLLVRGVNWLGDAVMTTPALQRLRQRFPQAHITLLTHEKLAGLWQNHPSLDAVITFPAKASFWSVARRLRTEHFDTALVLPNSPRSALEVWLAGIPRRIGYARSWRNWFLTQTVPTRPGHVRMHKRTPAEIQRLLADPSAFDLRPSDFPSPHPGPLPIEWGEGEGTPHPDPLPIEWGEGAIAGGRPRVNQTPGQWGQGEGQRFNASTLQRFNVPPSPHQIHEYLHLAAALGADAAPLPPQLHVTPEETVALTARLGLASGSRLLFGLNAGAEYGPAKRWPAERFLAAAVELQRRTHCQWIIFGGPADTQLAGEIAAGIQRHLADIPGSAPLEPPLNLAGKTTLRELMVCLKLCRVLLTNDTGPMHLAAALGTPVVVLFGSTSPELTGPGLPGDLRHRLLKAQVPCSPCFLRTCPIDFRCMQSLGVEQVVEAVLQISAWPGEGK